MSSHQPFMYSHRAIILGELASGRRLTSTLPFASQVLTYIFRVRYPSELKPSQFSQSLDFRLAESLMHLNETDQVLHDGFSLLSLSCRILGLTHSESI